MFGELYERFAVAIVRSLITGTVIVVMTIISTVLLCLFLRYIIKGE